MKTIDRYLASRFLGTLMRGLVAMVSLYVLIDLLTHREGAIAQFDVPWAVVARYYLAFVPKMVYQVAPLAMLVSALLVLGDCAQHNEVTAALASGISLRRFVRTPVLVALLFAVGLFAMEEVVGANATKEAARIERDYFQRNPDILREGMSWANLDGEWTCHIAKFNRIAITGEDVLIHSIRDDTVIQIQAGRIWWDDASQQWFLEDGVAYTFPSPTVRERSRITLQPAPFSETPEQLFALEQPTDTKTIGKLREELAYAEERAIPTDRLRTDYHAKFSWPALSFVMSGLAIPFAMRLRRGGIAISFGASIAIAMAYMIVYYVAMSLGYVGRIPPVTAAWFANALFLAAGAVLFARTPT